MKSTVQVQRFTPQALKLIPREEQTDAALVAELRSIVQDAQQQGIRSLVLDVQFLRSFTAEFVVFLLELTANQRRQGGDVVVLHLRSTTLEDLLTFNPKTYLSVANDEVDVMSHLESKRPPQTVAPRAPRVAADSEKKTSRIEIPYDEDAIYKACDVAIQAASDMGFPEKEVSRIKVAVYEACLNAMQHTRRSEAGETILVEVEHDNTALQINVYDHGRGFNVEKTREYDVTQAVSHRKTGGMGLHIIRKAMDDVDYQVDPLSGNKLIMVKYLPG